MSPWMLVLLFVQVAAAAAGATDMEAIVATRCGPKLPVLALESVPKPEASSLQPTQVMVEVVASSVNPVDWKILGCGTQFPTRTGWDLAGRVVAVGSGCQRLKAGDEVWADIAPTFGAFAEFVVVEEQQLGLAPRNLALQDAATLPLVGMTTLAAFGLTDARGVPAETWRQKPVALVLGGTGGCGSVGIQLAKALGASHVYATGSDVQYMQRLGADTAWDYRTTDWWVALADNSVDVIYDTVGVSGDADRGMKKLRVGGKFVTIAGSTSLHPKPGVAQAAIHNCKFS
jgi:NADPH:quinone reductase-like Zn-dependent oxidoreductase